MSRAKIFSRIVLSAALAGLMVTPSHAYRMIQNASIGRLTAGSLVTCNDAGGFLHWNLRWIDWYHNTAGQGSGKASALQSAMNSWTNVSGANHVLTYAGTTGAGWATDNVNTVLWASGNGCTGSCLALTALVVQAGQVIVETDVTFNSAVTWNTNGLDYDTEAVAAHEFGHTLGIHHTEVGAAPTPTMNATYFGVDGRTLETDDRSALQCSESRYPPPAPVYEGYLDSADCRTIKGWGWNINEPNGPINIDIKDGTRLLRSPLANEFRQDLLNAGKGNGKHGFTYTTPISVKDGLWHEIHAQFFGPSTELTGSPKNIICGVMVFTTQTPAEALSTGGTPYEVGNRIYSSHNGYITHLKFYKAPGETGTHTIRLWTETGTLLRSVTLGSETASGWQTGQLASPYPVTANTRYVVTVNTNTVQSKTACGFSTPISNGPLTAEGGYWVAGSGIFPTNGSCSNFWTDVIFDI